MDNAIAVFVEEMSRTTDDINKVLIAVSEKFGGPVDGAPWGAIADMLGVSEKTVVRDHERAISRMKYRLGDCYEEERRIATPRPSEGSSAEYDLPEQHHRWEDSLR